MEYPTLTQAAKHIAYDNGMVNRHSAEEEVIASMFARARTRCTLAEMQQAETELTMLTSDDLEEVCIGGEEEHSRISTVANNVLDALFD